MTMAELARVAQTKGDEHRWIRLEQLKERTTEREALVEEARLRRQARAAALPRVTGGTFPTQTPGERVPLLAVWQGGSLGRGVPRLGRTPTRPIGHSRSVVPSQDVLGLP